MLQVIQEVIDPKTKIEFCRMNDGSILLRVKGSINYFLSKKDIIDGIGEVYIIHISKEQIIAAFERLEGESTKKKNSMITALDGY